MSIGRRPLLAVLSLLPLGAVGSVAVSSRETAPLPEPDRTETTADAGPVTMWCPGALTVPAAMLGTGADDELALMPPSDTLGFGAVALETASSLLFGEVSGSATLQDEDGQVHAPDIVAEADGSVLDVPPASQDLGATVQRVQSTATAPRVTLTASRGGRPIADVVQSTVTADGDFRSLSITRALAPTADASFLGVSTATGDSSALVMRNVSSRAATASVQVWTQDGPAEMQGRSRIVVAPGEEQQLLLESVVSGHDSVGVRAATVGSPVTMHLRTTEREGLTPGGAEILSPFASAAQQSVIPGVHVLEGAQPVLYLLNTSGADTVATVTVLTAGGPVALPAPEGLELPSGQVVTVPLALPGPGDLAVRVNADAPVSAVVRCSVTGQDLPGDTVGAPVDFALAAPAPALSEGSVLALPATGPSGLLSLTATQDATVVVIPVGADGGAGEPLTVAISADTAVAVPATDLTGTDGPAAAVTITPDLPGAVHAAWVQREHEPAFGPLLSTVSVQPPQLSEGGLAVHLR